jgi:VWFA-related protein
MNSRWALTAAVFSGAGIALAAAQDPAQVAVREGVARNVYISAVDKDGAVVTDLKPEEIVVREDGKPRDVLKVEPATDPLQVALLIDDSGAGIQHIREGVARFIQVLRNRAEIAIVSTAGQNSVVVDFTSDYGAQMNGVNRLVTRTTSAGHLLDAIHEAAQALQRREARRPAVVVLALEGAEYSSVAPDHVYEAIRRSGAVVHVLSIGTPTLKTMTTRSQRPTDSVHEALDETVARGKVIVEAPRRSGGRLEQVLQPTGIPNKLMEIAYELRDQLAVTYARPASPKGPEKIDVSIKRRGIKLRAPKHVS